MPSTNPSDPPPSYSTDPPSTSKQKQHRHQHHSKKNSSAGVDDDATSGVKDKDHSVSRRSKKHSLSQDELLALARRGMQRSAFGPEFLKKLAAQSQGDGTRNSKGMPRFRVITGAEAKKMYHDATRDDDRDSSEGHDSQSHDRDHHKDHSSSKRNHHHHHTHNPVVFAFPGREAGAKVVDYYMTWKGKTRTHRLKGDRRRRDMLDAEFKKMVEGLEKEYNRQSVLAGADNDATLEIPVVLPAVSEHEHGEERSRSAPAVLEPETPASVSAEVQEPPPPRNVPIRPVFMSRESSSSVTSLPYLGMVRGVPAGNRVPLRLMNPDSASSMSADSRRASVATVAAALAKNSENPAINLSDSPLKKLTGLPAVQEVDADAEEDGEESRSAFPSLFSRKSGNARRARHRSYPRQDDSSSTAYSYDSRSLSGSSSTSDSHTYVSGDNKEILIVLMDEKDSDANPKPPHIRSSDVKLSRKSSTKPPTRTASTRTSPWDGPAASAESPRGNHLHPLDRKGSHSHSHSPSRSPYLHPYHSHSSHSSFSSLPGDTDTYDEDSDWDTEDLDSDYDEEDKESPRGLSLRAALETLRFHSRGYAKTPSPRRTPSHRQVGLPQVAPVMNPGTTIVVPNPSPYVAPSMAQLASQHGSPYVNLNANQIQAQAAASAHGLVSPAGSYGLAALYASPYAQSAPNLPQTSTPSRGQGQSPYVTPYISISPEHHVQNPIYPPGLGSHTPHHTPHSHHTPLHAATPHHTPGSTSVPLLASAYASPYVTQAQAPLPNTGAPAATLGGIYAAPAPSPYATPGNRPLYGGSTSVHGSVHGTPYAPGAGQQLPVYSPYVRAGTPGS